MQTKKRSLYTGHSQYTQHRYLKFRDSSTETRYQSDFNRMFRQSNSNPLSALIFIGLYTLGGQFDYIGFLTGLFVVVVLNITQPKSPYLHRVLEQPSILFWELGMLHSHSTSEMIGILLPSFLLNRSLLHNWREGGVSLVLDVLLLSVFKEGLLINGLLAVLVLTHVEALLEKDSRDLWVMYDSFKKSDSLMTLLIQNLEIPIFVLNQGASVIFNNRAAESLIKDLNETDGKAKGNCFYSFVDTCFRSRLKTIVDEVSTEKKYIRYECWSSNSPQRDVGRIVPRVALELTLSPQSWLEGNSVLVTCRDKSENIGRHSVVTQLIELILPASKFLTQEFTRKLKFQDNVRKEDLVRLNRLQMDIQGLHLISSFCANRIEMKTEMFNPLNELKNFIEFTSIKSFRKKVDVSLKTAKPLPKFVSAIRSTFDLLFDSLLNFAVDFAEASSTVEVKLSSIIGSKTKVDIEHEINFKSSTLSKEEFERQFSKSDKDNMSSTNLKETIDNYESYFAVLKVLLFLVPSHKLQISASQGGNYSVSYSFTVGVVPDHTIFRDVKISEAQVNKSPGTICWQAPGIEETPIQLVPITPSHDGSMQLNQQIHALRRNRKVKSLGAVKMSKLQRLGLNGTENSGDDDISEMAAVGEQVCSHVLTPQLRARSVRRHLT
mmetsp:Transcript_13718/g.25868  ORF Transcript_13718/g.25868 Transcript_13718/m.25868 type:complete len:662 (-) Transcript_13718:331-2316(-)